MWETQEIDQEITAENEIVLIRKTINLPNKKNLFNLFGLGSFFGADDGPLDEDWIDSW